MPRKPSKAAAVQTAAPQDRRCSFRAVATAKKRVGTGPLTIEHRLYGSTIWIPSITGLDAEDVNKALGHLEERGCGIEYNEFFQPAKVKKRR